MQTNYEISDELYHYGVKGMKWGVRRDVEVIANNRRNVAVRKAKRAYSDGKISSEQKKTAIRKANAEKKAYMDKVKKDYENTSSTTKKEKMDSNIRKEASKIQNRHVVKGLKAYSAVAAGYGIGTMAVTAASAALANPAAAAVLGVTAAGYTVGQLGAKYVRDRLIDKLS